MKKSLQILFAFVFVGLSAIAQPTLWSMTEYSGASVPGTIFKINPDGSGYAVAHIFNGSQGYLPQGSLMKASNGKMYGMLSSGGSHGGGVLFRFNSATNVVDTVHNFSGGSNGPTGNLIQGPNGKLYGLTRNGGSYGSIFSYDTASNTYAALYVFQNLPTSGLLPYGSLLLATDGNMYGMTYEGGSGGGYGTLFRFNPTTNVYTNMYGFNFTNGAYPYGSLIQAANGKLYGMAQQGGAPNQGVIFSYHIPDSTLTVLHSFNTTDGSQPNGDLVEVSGKLYGMTNLGGAHSAGMLFSMDTLGTTYDTLMSFDGAAHGSKPLGSLLHYSGKLYGMTNLGGSHTGGMIFAWNIALNQFDTLRNMNITTDGNYPYYSSFILVNDNATDVTTPLATASAISIYPNPANTTVTIHSPMSILNSQLFISDVLGNKIYQQTLTDIDTKIDVSKWSEGIYFYEIKGNENSRGKFEVQK